MPFWAFKYYRAEDGGCPIRDWYSGQEPAVRAQMDAACFHLAGEETWEEEDSFEVFTDKPEHLGLAEVKFEVSEGNKKRQYRVIGLWHQEEREFICLMGFRKNGRSPDPPNAFRIALDLRIELEEGKGFCDDNI